MRAFTITLSNVACCPIHSLSPLHYNDDGTCRCQPREEPMTETTEPTWSAAPPPAWVVDNRWSPGASGATVPGPAFGTAAYSARWIDQGDWQPGDIVPDRQGIAYNELRFRDALIERLNRANGHRMIADRSLPRDVTVHLIDDGRLQMYVRRQGGYIYVDAWMPAAVGDENTPPLKGTDG